jgi:hypothetical protein
MAGAPLERVDDLEVSGLFCRVGVYIDERAKAASPAYGRLMPVWKARLGKVAGVQDDGEPVLFYACETWPLTVIRGRRLSSC